MQAHLKEWTLYARDENGDDVDLHLNSLIDIKLICEKDMYKIELCYHSRNIEDIDLRFNISTLYIKHDTIDKLTFDEKEVELCSTKVGTYTRSFTFLIKLNHVKNNNKIKETIENEDSEI